MMLQDVQRKAKFGHRDWLYWRESNGVYGAAPRSAESIKAMLLVTGSKGWWCLINANCGTLLKGRWDIGINIWSQSKRGWAITQEARKARAKRSEYHR